MPKPPANIKAQVSPAEFSVTVLDTRFQNREAQEFVSIMSFFVYQAKEERRFTEFFAQACARYFAEYPEAYAKNLPARVALIKAKIWSQFKGSYWHQRQAVPQIHWENFLALDVPDILEIGAVIRAQAKEKRVAAFKKVPGLRNDALDLLGHLTGKRPLVQHAAAEVPVNPKNPEGRLRIIDATEGEVSVDIPDKDGVFVEFVIDMTLDEQEFSDEDTHRLDDDNHAVDKMGVPDAAPPEVDM